MESATPEPRHAAAGDQPRRTAPRLALVSDRLVLAEPAEAPGAQWQGAMAQLEAWLGIAIARIPHERAPGSLRHHLASKWQGARTSAAAAPVFAPWLTHAAHAFQDPRAVLGPVRARWVASYLWDPCGGGRAGPVQRGIDTMLLSAHPAACRTDEDCAAALPTAPVLREMIAAARAEGRSRIAIIGYERTRSAATRQLLSARPALAGPGEEIEVLGIEQALVRLSAHPSAWDAIIVLPELRSMVFAILAEAAGIAGPWPMVWHRQGVVLVCGESAGAAAVNGPLDTALLVQSLALAARAGGNGFAASRLAEGWAQLRDRGMVTPARGSPAPYVTQASDAAFLERLCMGPDDRARPLPAWKAIRLTAQDEPRPAAPRPPAQLALVAKG